MNATFTFIESNTTGTGRSCLQRARERGFRVLFLTSRPELYPFLAEELVVPHIVDTTDADAISDLLMREGGAHGVMSTSEYFIEIAAEVAARFSLVAPDAEAVRTCRHKGQCVRVLEKAGVNVPRTVEVTSLAALEALAPAMTFPVVMKPVSGSGSVGVRMISDAAELLAAGSRLLSAERNERGLPVPAGILVQQFIAGDEYSVEVFSDHVIGVTKKHLGRAPFFVETGHDFPARVSADLEAAIRAEVLRALSALGYRSGPSHVEVRIASDGRPAIIEVNPRLAGMIPRAIEMATGIDLLGAVVDFFARRNVDLAPVRDRRAAIRFFVAERPGTIEAFHAPALDGVDAVFAPLKPVGAHVEPRGDFRDRLAYVIVASENDARLEEAVASVSTHPAVQLREGPASSASGNTGRLRTILRPEALDIVAKTPSPDARIAQLDRLTAIDEAHLAMLVEAGILAAADVAPVLSEIGALRAGRYAELAGESAPRGVYVLYEQLLIARLGERVGGVVHTARSRNDINACVFKLEVREWLTATFRSLWRLRAALLAKAGETGDVILPVYSQFQPGQPGTLAYYLWSLDAALRRDQRALLDLFDDLQVSPMGAGAGAGTDFPIQPELTAAILGFSTTNRSALDAVASRDLALRLLGAWAVCSTALSRLAQDLQLWTMGDVALFDLPDDLAGGSSMMPQKRNPYLLEIAKGKLVSLPTALGFALHAMQKTPFSNSVEVGTEGVSGCAQAATAFSESCDLLRLMVEALVPRTGRGEAAARNGAVVATQVANALVRERDISFHEAHRRVGAHITAALETGVEPLQSLQELAEGPLDDLRAAVRALAYGGGPGAVPRELGASQAGLRHDADELARRTQCWSEADRRRKSVVQSLIAEGSRST